MTFPRLRLLYVTGNSMYPGLAYGDCAIVKLRMDESEPLPSVGSIVLFRHGPKNWEFVKRVAATPGDLVPGSSETVPLHHVWVLGDNPKWSSDSRHFGAIAAAELVGTVILRIPIGIGPGATDSIAYDT